ncbi:MarR family transcriptional regulator [Granulicella sp. WH15]|uniref:MarR family winged helix-turn-helix transcriptional regulator n=1 Tax=Granulicella sp. WH15 TaxID=2602070 RepID=UPI001367821E|nr:MarR family transcriptional regulator [Granulicella sp. WH15]QHN04082.1 MarR family transcriptional regulator [Granulicella sp. WH15]
MPNQSPDTIDRLPQLANFRFRLRQFLAYSESTCEESGVTMQQYQLLQVLGAARMEADAARTTISALAERLLLRHNSAVELVDRAERAGLVRRVADPTDHRRAVVEITPHGQELLAKLTGEHLSYLATAAPELASSLQELLPSQR